jgi:hypothetical protein
MVIKFCIEAFFFSSFMLFNGPENSAFWKLESNEHVTTYCLFLETSSLLTSSVDRDINIKRKPGKVKL